MVGIAIVNQWTEVALVIPRIKKTLKSCGLYAILCILEKKTKKKMMKMMENHLTKRYSNNK